MFEERLEHSYLSTKISLIVAFGLGFFVCYVINSISPGEKIIMVPPELGKEIRFSGSRANPEYLEEMALFFIPYLTNVHPHTVDKSVDFFLRYVGPENYGEIKATLKAEVIRIKQQEVSQAFYVKNTRVTGNTVIIEGQLRRYIGTAKTSEVPYKYELTFEKNITNNIRLINNFTHSLLQ